jgi:Rod binding domain-containing protein
MTVVRGLPVAGATTTAGRREQLRRVAHQLEGVFLNQLFQAMRASVPEDGFLAAAPGQELFTSLLDERLADQAAARMHNGIGEALYRQLARRLPPEDPAATPDS